MIKQSLHRTARLQLATGRRSFLKLVAFAPLGYRLIQSSRLTNMWNLYVGTYTDGASEGIYQCRMNAETGGLETMSSTSGIENPSFLALDPSGRTMYAVSETSSFGGTEGGGVFAYSIDAETRSLRALNAKPSHGGAPCYVSVTPDGRHVLVANYVGGNVAIYPIEAEGRLGESTDVEQHEGSSVDKNRQEGPHAHCILSDSAGAFVFAVDLGIDRVVIYRLDRGELVRTGHTALEPGAGPRHLTFDPTGDRAYVINELDSTVTAFAYDDGVLEPIHTVRTLPEEFEGESYCADIHVSIDGRFVYGSNRGHDSIVVFAVEAETGRLSPIQHVGTGGSWPRNFAIDPSGRFLLAANQHSDNIVVFAIDGTSGRLEATGHALEIPSPVCIRFAS